MKKLDDLDRETRYLTKDQSQYESRLKEKIQKINSNI